MKILLLSSHTPSLFWFRTDLMKEMLAEGCEVVAAAQMSEIEWHDKFASLGVKYREIRVTRNGLNPMEDFRTLKDIKRLLQEECPDKIFAFQAKTIGYGAIAASRFGISEFYPMVAGLGSVFRGKGMKNYFVKVVMSVLYKQAFRKSKRVFFQNNDDRQLLVNARVLDDKQIVMTHGSGVNTEKFQPMPFPDKPTFLFIGRLIRDKGISEYLSACEKIKQEFHNQVRCLLVGPYDSNPTALKAEELQPLIDSNVVEYYGEQNDVRPFIAMSTVFVLPSYHEGTPKTVLESMAMGRAIITTDAPGCRETVKDGWNGYLVKVKSVDSVVDMMRMFIATPELAVRMGQRSRVIASNTFDVKKVDDVILRAMGIRS